MRSYLYLMQYKCMALTDHRRTRYDHIPVAECLKMEWFSIQRRKDCSYKLFVRCMTELCLSSVVIWKALMISTSGYYTNDYKRDPIFTRAMPMAMSPTPAIIGMASLCKVLNVFVKLLVPGVAGTLWSCVAVIKSKTTIIISKNPTNNNPKPTFLVIISS